MSGPLALVVLYGAVVAAAAVAARWAGRRLAARETALMAIVPLLLFFPGFFRSRTLLPVDHAMLLSPWSHLAPAHRRNANLNDAITQMAPWAKAVRMAWKEGSLPLRDRWNGCGMALAANGQSAAFSPFTALTLPVALADAFMVMAAAKVFLALAGTFLWLSELGLSRGAALFGGVLFALSSSMAAWLLFPQSAVLSLLPWVLFAIEAMRYPSPRRPWRAFALLTLLFTAWPLCGHPESVVVGAGFAGLWLVSRAALSDLPGATRLAGRIGLAALLAIGLSAFLLVPQAIAIRASNRVRFAEALRGRLPTSARPHLPFLPAGFATTVFPRTLGDAIDSPMLPGGLGNFSEMSLGFFGIVGLSAALLVFRPGSRRSRTALAFLVPLVAGLAIGTGTWPLYDLVIHLPVVRLTFVLRWLSWFAFAGAGLAAFEADRLARDLALGDLRPSPARAAGFAAAVGGGLALAGLALWRFMAPLHAAAGGSASQRGALAASLGAAAAFAAACAGGLSPRTRRAVPALLAAAALAELALFETRFHRFGRPELLFPETPLVRFLDSRPRPFRASGDAAVLFPGSNVFAGVEDVRTHDPVEREDYVDFLDRAAGYPPAEYFKNIRDWNAPELDLLNLVYLAGEPGQTFAGARWKRVYDGPDGVVYENSDALPRVYAAARMDPAARHAPDGFELSAYRETTNAISFSTRARAAVPAVVAVVQDGGWTATDEAGRSIPTSKAASVLLALEVPAGEHTIRLRYRPPGFAAGAAVSLATVAALIAAAVVLSFTARTRKYRPGSGETGSG
jgi:hypothetical protein